MKDPALTDLDLYTIEDNDLDMYATRRHLVVVLRAPELYEGEWKAGVCRPIRHPFSESDARWSAWWAAGLFTRLSAHARPVLRREAQEHGCATQDFDFCQIGNENIELYTRDGEVVPPSLSFVVPRGKKREWLQKATRACANLDAEDREWGQVIW